MSKRENERMSKKTMRDKIRWAEMRWNETSHTTHNKNAYNNRPIHAKVSLLLFSRRYLTFSTCLSLQAICAHPESNENNKHVNKILLYSVCPFIFKHSHDYEKVDIDMLQYLNCTATRRYIVKQNNSSCNEREAKKTKLQTGNWQK